MVIDGENLMEPKYICVHCKGTKFTELKRFDTEETYLGCEKCFFAEPKKESSIDDIAQDVHLLTVKIEDIKHCVELILINQNQRVKK